MDGKAGELGMVEGDSSPDLGLIAIGDAKDVPNQDAVRLADEYELELTVCEDVYSAVAALAARTGKRFLIVGRLRRLASEDGLFFQVAARNGARCLCVLETDRAPDRGEVLAALGAGAQVVGRVEDVRAILEEWLSRNDCDDDLPVGRSRAIEEFRTTDAELDALLGHELDG